MRIAIVDYDMGNVHSVQNALEYLGYQSVLASTGQGIKQADMLILPGVGAFGDGVKALKDKELFAPILDFAQTGKIMAGICLGMQLLLTKSFEMGEHQGLNLIEGEVLRFDFKDTQLKVPHMGWNQVVPERTSKLFEGLKSNPFCYFVHSYYVQPKQKELCLAQTEYGHNFCSVVQKDNLYGLQFHPEKSQDAGLQMLKNLVHMAEQQ